MKDIIEKIKAYLDRRKIVRVDDDDMGKYATSQKTTVWIGGTGNTGRLIRTILTVVGFAILATLGLYIALGATLIRATPTPGWDGVTVIRSGTFLGGNPPVGAHAYVSTKPYEGTLLQKLQHSFTPLPGGSVVEVVAGPFGELSVNPDTTAILFNGEETGYTLPEGVELPTQYVGDNFLTLCVAGECEGESALSVTEKNTIWGEVVSSTMVDLP